MRKSAGARRHRITIEYPTVSQNPTNGEKTPTWSTYATRWANIETAGTRDLRIAESFSVEVSHRVNLLYDAGVKTTHRFTYQGRIFAINGIIAAPDKSEMDLFCTETTKGN